MAELSIGRKKAVERKTELERPSLAQVWELSYLIRPIPQIPTGLSRELKRFLDLPHQLDCWSSINTMEPGSSGLPLSGAEYNQFRHTVQQNAAIALRLRVASIARARLFQEADRWRFCNLLKIGARI